MFHINGDEWRVVYVSPSHYKLRRSDGSSSIGACDYETKTIYISFDVPDRKLKKVLCHEITHAAMFSYDVDLSI